MKKPLISIVLAIIVVLGIEILFGVRSCNEKQTYIDGLENELYSLKDSFQREKKIWRDKDSQQHISIRTTQITAPQLIGYVRQDAKKLGIKTKQINSKSSVVVTTSISELILKRDTTYIDSSKTIYPEFNYQDEWLTVDIKQFDSLNFILNLSTFDTLTSIKYWKRTWVLGKKRWYTDVRTNSPYNELMSSISLETLPPRKTSIYLAPYFGVGYDGRNIRPSLGLGLIYTGISLKLR